MELVNESAESGDCFLVLKPFDNDPMLEEKKKVLESKGIDPIGGITLKKTSSGDWLSNTLETLVQKARVVCSDEVELYFGEADTNDPSARLCNPIIELEALHSSLLVIDETLSRVSTADVTTTSVLHDLRSANISMIRELGDKTDRTTKTVTANSCDKENLLVKWGESNGIKTKLEVAYVEGAGRGAIATEDLQVGHVAMEIPESVIISEELVHESDMFPVLEKIDGISSETMLLLWSMKEKHNINSKFRFYFDALPEAFNTGLSFGINAIMTLDGTLLLEEIMQAKEHLRMQYDELFPTLCDDHPEIFPADLFTWEKFLWACELWYSNSMKVKFTDGKLRICLVPIAGFLNHSLCPHILHYGKVDPVTKSLKFPLSRPCKAGEQCYLSYGKFSTSHLVTFYGFVPERVNPYDIIPLDIDSEEPNSSDDNSSKSNWTNHMVRGTWLSNNHGLFHYGLPTPLLDYFRKAQSLVSQTETQEYLEGETEMLQNLRFTFEDMMDTLGDDTVEDSRNSASWDVKLAMKCKDIQRSIVSSVLTSCHSGIGLVEHELSKRRG